MAGEYDSKLLLYIKKPDETIFHFDLLMSDIMIVFNTRHTEERAFSQLITLY